jgi:ribose 5-phosphate isomerase A
MTLAEDLIEGQKRAAAIAAVAEVETGMLIGLGTGSTAAYAIEELARRVRGGLAVHAVSTSERTTALASHAGIEVLDFQGIETIDLAIDGVDEIDAGFLAIKGGGGAMLREKIVAGAARRMIAIADASKLVARLGTRPVPLEVLPFATASVLRHVRDVGCEPVLRHIGAEPFQTDQANFVIDCRFPAIDDPRQLAARLGSIPGVLAHGLFLHEIDALYLGTSQGVQRSDRPTNLSD